MMRKLVLGALAVITLISAALLGASLLSNDAQSRYAALGGPLPIELRGGRLLFYTARSPICVEGAWTLTDEIDELVRDRRFFDGSWRETNGIEPAVLAAWNVEQEFAPPRQSPVACHEVLAEDVAEWTRLQADLLAPGGLYQAGVDGGRTLLVVRPKERVVYWYEGD